MCAMCLVNELLLQMHFADACGNLFSGMLVVFEGFFFPINRL